MLASYGHIRDLPSKAGSVKPDQDFEMVWEFTPGAGPRYAAIEDAVRGADKVGGRAGFGGWGGSHAAQLVLLVWVRAAGLLKPGCAVQTCVGMRSNALWSCNLC